MDRKILYQQTERRKQPNVSFIYESILLQFNDRIQILHIDSFLFALLISYSLTKIFDVS